MLAGNRSKASSRAAIASLSLPLRQLGLDLQVPPRLTPAVVLDPDIDGLRAFVVLPGSEQLLRIFQIRRGRRRAQEPETQRENGSLKPAGAASTPQSAAQRPTLQR